MALTKKNNETFPVDERQAELYMKFSQETFLGSERNVVNFIAWVTFFRRNLHRFAMDYLGIRLHVYQIIMLYLMGINNFIVVIASRASAKSFIIALYACCRCILYPNSKIVLCSGTKGQSKLLVSEKIEKELMNMSTTLRKEIRKIKDNQNEIVVEFKNHSTITVVPASENGRGYRSTVVVREEFRQIKKSVEDSVISPLQMVRQPPYMMDMFYSSDSFKEEPTDIYISSSWYDNGNNEDDKNWMWKIVDQAYDGMFKNKGNVLLAFDESIAIKHKIKTMRYFQSEKKKQDPITWELEFMNSRVRENTKAFFSLSMLQQNQTCKQPFFPRTILDVRNGKRNPYDIPKQKGEIRIVSCDMAFVANKGNDNSAFSLIRCLPETKTFKDDNSGEVIVDNGYHRICPYIEHRPGGEIRLQAIRIMQLFQDFQADYICLDLRNSGRNAVYYGNIITISAKESGDTVM